MSGVFFRIVVLMASLLTFTASANGQAHLTFHMGAGANQQFFVGGTVENRGDTTIARAYVSVLPVDERCQLLPMAWKEFGPIPAHDKVEFRVPVTSALTQYRLVSFGAFDDMGFAVAAVDDTAAIMKAREPEIRQACLAKRQ